MRSPRWRLLGCSRDAPVGKVRRLLRRPTLAGMGVRGRRAGSRPGDLHLARAGIQGRPDRGARPSTRACSIDPCPRIGTRSPDVECPTGNAVRDQVPVVIRLAISPNATAGSASRSRGRWVVPDAIGDGIGPDPGSFPPRDRARPHLAPLPAAHGRTSARRVTLRVGDGPLPIELMSQRSTSQHPTAPLDIAAYLARFAWHPEPELIVRDPAVSRAALERLGDGAWGAALDYLYDEAPAGDGRAGPTPSCVRGYFGASGGPRRRRSPRPRRRRARRVPDRDRGRTAERLAPADVQLLHAAAAADVDRSARCSPS